LQITLYRKTDLRNFNGYLHAMSITSNERILHLAMAWGFAESGLGGIFHAFKLPFTAFILCAISIAAMARIAVISKNPFRDILQALVLVLSIKFLGSPHSPVTAYVAVAFQGMVGSVFFSWRVNTFSCMVAGFLMMGESALQKPLVATLLFGESIWVALDDWFNKITSFFGLATIKQLSYKIIAAYVLLYMLWGMGWGWLTARFLLQMKKREKAITRLYQILSLRYPQELQKKNSGNRFKILWLLVIIMAGILSYFQSNVYVLFRVLIVMLIFYMVILPFMRWILKRITQREWHTLYEERLPLYQNRLAIAWAYAKSKNGRWHIAFTFLFFVQAFIFLPAENDK